tara:strand:- start:260 stop:973 length:714 start_codon:yes stop_codon:yes gene_type:complete
MNIDYVKTPFTNNPSMTRLEGPVYNKNPDKIYIHEKQKQIDLLGEQLLGETEISKEKNLIKKLINFCNLDNNLSLSELTTKFEEDFVIMYKGKMEIVSVCFPSGWIPKEKLGKNLSDIHEPIADSEQLIKASDKLTDYMTKQRIKRWVWTITTSKELSNFPDYEKPELTRFEDLYFRVETQTTAPVDDKTSLFFIKVDVLPLSQVWDKKILKSINSMTDNVLKYKGLEQIKELLNRV